jgi:hypothetical protein
MGFDGFKGRRKLERAPSNAQRIAGSHHGVSRRRDVDAARVQASPIALSCDMTSLRETILHDSSSPHQLYMSSTPLTLVLTPCTHLFRLQTRFLSSETPRAARLLTSTQKRGPAIEKQLSAYLQRQHSPRRTSSPATPATMSFLLPGLRRGLVLSSPLLLSTPLLAYQYRHTQPIRCDSADPLAKLGDLRNKYASDAKTPVITQSGAANPRAVRQISMGSILGLVGGLGVSVFSKPLAILIGLGVILVHVSQEG